MDPEETVSLITGIYSKKHTFPPIEYRITDGTELDDARRFWIMSYQWSGDVSLQIGEDPVFQQFGTGNEWAYDLGDIGFFYRGYEQIMSHWRAVLPIPMYELHYENLVSNHEPECRRLLEYCGLSWSPDCLRFHEQPRSVLTGSNWQVRQPLYSGSVNRWRHYEPYLDELRSALEA